MIEDVLTVLIVFAALFGIVYVFVSARTKERIALLEHGKTAEVFHYNNAKSKGGIFLLLGFFLMGVGIGTFVGAILELIGLRPDVAYPASITFFAGALLIGGYYAGRDSEMMADGTWQGYEDWMEPGKKKQNQAE